MHMPVTQSLSTQEIVDRSENCFRHLPGAKANLHSRNRPVLCSVLERFPRCLGLIWRLKYARGMLPAELKDSATKKSIHALFLWNMEEMRKMCFLKMTKSFWHRNQND